MFRHRPAFFPGHYAASSSTRGLPPRLASLKRVRTTLGWLSEKLGQDGRPGSRLQRLGTSSLEPCACQGRGGNWACFGWETGKRFGGLSSASKESACSERGLGSIPGLGRSPEKGTATHSSILAWRIPWTEEPGGLQPMRSQTVEHDWTTFTFHFCTCKVCSEYYIPRPVHVVHHTGIAFLHPSPLHGFK